MQETGSGHDKELIFSAILFMSNMLCNIIHDIIDKHAYIWTVLETTGFSYCSKGWTFWLMF